MSDTVSRMLMLPPAGDTCPICAAMHGAADPHDAQSLYYQLRFHAVRGRWPTWADAIAHCDEELQDAWRTELTRVGAWTEPPTGVDVVADPLHDSLHQQTPVGEPPRIVQMGPEDQHAAS